MSKQPAKQCNDCQVQILESTYSRNHGRCQPCANVRVRFREFEEHLLKASLPPTPEAPWSPESSRPLVSVSPLGTYALLPAFLIGYDCTERNLRSSPKFPNSVPSWLWHLEQQAGGLAMSYPAAFGALLRFSDNRDQAKEPVDDLIRAFWAMAEDPDTRFLSRNWPNLRPLVATRGQPYSPAECETLTAVLQRYFEVPAVTTGLEAFVGLEESDLLMHFGGWHPLGMNLLPKHELIGPPYIVDEWSFPNLRVDCQQRLTAEILEELEEFAASVYLFSKPRAYLLWENSD